MIHLSSHRILSPIEALRFSCLGNVAELTSITTHVLHSCRNEFLQEKLAFWYWITANTAEGLTKALWREEEIREMGFWLCRQREREFWKSGCPISWQKRIYSSRDNNHSLLENEPKIPRQRVWGCNHGFSCELEICLISRKSLPKVEFVVPTPALLY